MPGPAIRCHKHRMIDLPDLADAKLMLGAAAIILGEEHAVTRALARAVTTRKPEDIEASRVALCQRPRDQREAIAAAVEQAWEGEEK